MRLIIHDLDSDMAKNILPASEDACIISSNSKIQNCIGCFGCWIKTPGKCVIRDAYEDMGEMLAKVDELIILSECFYGGFSPFVKNVLDRSISYIHPYFVIKNGEMHHKNRYPNHFDMKIFLYGENITPKEKETASNLAQANAINLYSQVKELNFAQVAQEFAGKV